MKKLPRRGCRIIFEQNENFAHNYVKIRIKCPECLRCINPKSHVHVFRNTSGLWRHIKTEHIELSDFQLDEIKEILKKISVAAHLGMLGS